MSRFAGVTLALLARADVVSKEDEPAGQLIAEALRMALEEVTQSNQPWEPGWTLVVIGDDWTGDELVTVIMPTEVVVSHCPWLGDEQREIVARSLPIDERRVVLFVHGYSATVRYCVPGGKVSN